MRAIASNLFLDGNTFEKSLSVEKHSLVGDLQLDAVLAVGAASSVVHYVFRSKEFTAQRRTD